MHELTIWLKKTAGLLFLLFPLALLSQQVDLEKVQLLARDNYPLIKQKDLLKQTAGLNINNLQKGFLPQLSFNGQASYQSDVTTVEVPVPGIKIEAPGRDQYKMTADINQLVYDGGTTRHQKVLQQLQYEVSGQQVEVELYRLRERINEVYLSVLFVDEQVKQVALLQQDLAIGISRVEAQVRNGVAFKSNLSALRAEEIKVGQRLVGLSSTRKSLLKTLAMFTGQPISDSTRLLKPSPPDVVTFKEIARPEIKLMDDRTKLLGQQVQLIRSRNLPRASVFVQGGYGRPGLNMLKNQFDLFYIGGVRLSWSLGALYTARNERQLVRLNQDIVGREKETFVLNARSELIRQQAEIEKLQELLQSDDEIIALRRTVTDAAKAQLENGVITSADYLREVNAEDQSRQQRIAHEIELLQAQINYKTIIGN